MLEDSIQKQIFSSSKEKTYTDKILAREDVQAVKEIIKKERLDRKDLTELLYLLSSTEAKLLNLGKWERYVMGKFYVWVREFVSIAELLYDYKEDLQRKESLCFTCKGYVSSKEYKPTKSDKTCDCTKPYLREAITPRTRQMFENNMRLMEHNVKFLIDLFFHMGRTSLSLGATGFMELLKQKFELFYPNLQTKAQEPKQGLFK